MDWAQNFVGLKIIWRIKFAGKIYLFDFVSYFWFLNVHKIILSVHHIIEVIYMDDNKNRWKDRPKSNAELRKIDPKGNSDLGIIKGKKLGAPPHKEKDHL